MLYISKNKIGPRILPFIERDAATPTARTLKVPRNSESPIPDNGPSMQF